MTDNIRHLLLKTISIFPKWRVLARFYLSGNNVIIVKPDGVQVKNPIKKRFDINMRGKCSGNTIVFAEQQAQKCNIIFSFRDAKNNKITIGQDNRILNMDFRVQGVGGVATFGNENSINSAVVHMCCSGDNTVFTIGNGNLFSRGIVFWVGDSHSVLSKDKRLLNAGGNVKIGNNNWIGQNVCFLKKSGITDGCIVGYGSIVTKFFAVQQCVLAGNPAKCVKENVLWSEQFPAEYDGKLYRQI